MPRPLVTRLSALGLLAVGAGVACAAAAPPPVAQPAPIASTAAPAPSPSASMSPAMALPTTLMPGIGMAPSKPGAAAAEEDEPQGPPPPCSKDEDCWSKTCCPAKAPEECVHAMKARRCAIVDVSCAKTPVHYTCFCEAGACKGRLAPP